MENVDPEKRKIYLFGEINETTAYGLISSLDERDPSKGVEIVMCSMGGHEDSGWACIDAMLSFPGHITMTCFGHCESIAAAILQAADLRVLQPNCTFMIHDGNIELSGSFPQRKVQEMATEIETGANKYYTILHKRSGQPLQTIYEWCKKETYFTAKEACNYGFADVLATPIKNFDKKKGKRKNG